MKPDCIYYKDCPTAGEACKTCQSYIGRDELGEPRSEPRAKKTYRLRESTIRRLRRHWADSGETFDDIVENAINYYLDKEMK